MFEDEFKSWSVEETVEGLERMLKEMESVLVEQCFCEEVSLEVFNEHMKDCLTIRWAISHLKAVK